ncbi:superoxide dismutase family protein [Flagellimonas marinaquae]|uniref:Superoxide dismutase family protein n=1 Tax=Flagellimonas aurea TaxID=2915619 RepID=A0ABS3G495_9FLAO|nr:superoxide dismutase family protein [Allomuricauda aurea]MAO18549.1 superoxide dismutase [Allomuricauda sp.]MBO0354103.1 superoxide dismutase family protein [Allomuricauda aurea]UBZ14248.1 superoxide dismutase family protein [Allomuricauda aquimarina]|tara:strand:- start:392 stop:979 length:588 start_codon:yes stop_codon:yes gene_type:complete
MKSIQVIALALVFITAFSCKEAKKETEEATEEIEETVDQVVETIDPEVITFSMEPKSDSNVNGEVVFTQDNGEVIMRATFTGLDEGEHAIHLHEKADCSSADGKSTGGHWNPTFEKHGKWGAEDGYHKGDIGNFTADADGNATVDFSTDEWCIGCDDEKKNILGKAVIVHQGVDDYTSQPSGAAGARIACTGIIQ